MPNKWLYSVKARVKIFHSTDSFLVKSISRDVGRWVGVCVCASPLMQGSRKQFHHTKTTPRCYYENTIKLLIQQLGTYNYVSERRKKEKDGQNIGFMSFMLWFLLTPCCIKIIITQYHTRKLFYNIIILIREL